MRVVVVGVGGGCYEGGCCGGCLVAMGWLLWGLSGGCCGGWWWLSGGCCGGCLDLAVVVGVVWQLLWGVS